MSARWFDATVFNRTVRLCPHQPHKRQVSTWQANFFMSPFQTARNTLSSPLQFSIKHNKTVCCGKKQKIKKFPPLPQFSIITPKHSQQPNQPRERVLSTEAAHVAFRTQESRPFPPFHTLLHTQQLITTARAVATRHTGPKER